MEKTTESRFIENKRMPPLRQNNLKGSNQIQQKKNNLTSMKINQITPSQALKETNKEKRPNMPQKQATKNIWISSIRDIIRDEPVKVANVKKAPVVQNKNPIKKTQTFKPINNAPRNQSSKPVFTISASLKNSMQQQSPKVKNNSNISQNSKSATIEKASDKISSNNVINKHSSKLTPIKTQTPKLPKKIENPQINVTQNTPVLPKSPHLISIRSPSPISIQPDKNNKSQKDNNKVFKSICVFVFLIIMFIIMLYSPYLL